MELPGSNPKVKLEVSLAMLADSTMAVEVSLSNALVAWPYFTDISLVGCLAGRSAARWRGGACGSGGHTRAR